MDSSLPTRELSHAADPGQIEREAQELLEAFLKGEHEAVAEVNIHHRDADPDAFTLRDAQLTLARGYGFETWAKLAAYVSGASVAALADAVRANDLARVGAMLDARSWCACIWRRTTSTRRCITPCTRGCRR